MPRSGALPSPQSPASPTASTILSSTLGTKYILPHRLLFVLYYWIIYILYYIILYLVYIWAPSSKNCHGHAARHFKSSCSRSGIIWVEILPQDHKCQCKALTDLLFMGKMMYIWVPRSIEGCQKTPVSGCVQ